MSSIIDIGKGWFGDSAGSPRFAQPFVGASLLQDFGEGGSGIIVKINMPGGSVKTPANGTLRYIPNLGSLADDKKAAIVARWPELRLLDGSRYGPDGLDEGTLLFEI